MAVIRIGLISDTHGLLRPQAKAFLEDCAHIVHAGDIGSRAILDELATLAPVTAVRGNNDHDPKSESLPETRTLSIGSTAIYVLHDLNTLAIDPAAAGYRVVVYGHSHRPSVEERQGVLYVNPGSAGPRRFRLPVAVAELFVDDSFVSAHWVELDLDEGD